MATNDDDPTAPGSTAACVCQCQPQHLRLAQEPTSPAWEKISADTVLTQTAAFYDVTITDLRGTAQEIERPRNIAAYLCRQLTALSYVDVGAALDRGHTFALAAYKQVRNDMAAEPQLRHEAHEIAARVTAATAA